MTEPIRTRAEAQAILDFVARVGERHDHYRISVGLALQEELDKLAKETGVKQSFLRFPPTMSDGGQGWDTDGNLVDL